MFSRKALIDEDLKVIANDFREAITAAETNF